MRRTRQRISPLFLAVAAIGLSSAIGCGSMWERVRENERGYAVENARSDAKRGKCVEALEGLDRAQAIMSIDRFAIEANQIRIRCYEKLGLSEQQSAHRRLLDDYYRDEPMAFPAADGSSVFRVAEGAPVRFDRPPSWLLIERPRYTAYAQRSKIVGRVVVSFGLTANGQTTRIRVLEMPHPLLASWAIEAVAKARPKRKGQVPIIESDRTYVTTFNFEWRWADE
ncbi:MAG: TonB family protein [Myxococcota bacterium]